MQARDLSSNALSERAISNRLKALSDHDKMPMSMDGLHKCVVNQHATQRSPAGNRSLSAGIILIVIAIPVWKVQFYRVQVVPANAMICVTEFPTRSTAGHAG